MESPTVLGEVKGPYRELVGSVVGTLGYDLKGRSVGSRWDEDLS